METRKYQIIRDDEHKIEYEGKTLYRIQALRDVSTRVKAGDMGGYIENYDNLSQVNECWVGGNAKVMGNARVVGDAIVNNEAIVKDNAVIANDGKVFDEAIVFSSARIIDNAMVMDNAQVSGFSRIMNSAVVGGNAQVFDLAVVRDSANVYGYAKVSGRAHIRDYAEVHDAVVKDNALIMDHSEISDDSVIGTDVIVCGISHIRGKSVIISTSYEDKNIRIMGLDLNDHARINSFKDFIMVHNVANKYDILAYHKAIPSPKDVNPEDFVKTLKNEDFIKISVQKLFPLHAIEFEGTFSEYLQWANKEPNPITSDTYMEYIAVAQLINYRFKKIFLQQ